MVQKHRSASKAAYAKDMSPMRNMNINKQELSSSPATSATLAAFGTHLNVPMANTSRNAPTKSGNDKWKYNNMVTQNREQFNGLHFC